MIFKNIQILPFIIIFLVLYIGITYKQHKKFQAWIKDHWFFDQSFSSKLSKICFWISISLLALSLLDLRGPEEKITGKTSNQKTIILIDSSASMLAEDVRPNRFNKALLLVKHYVRKAVGQKIAINVFSDGQKTIVPFTDDYDLVKARVDMLDNLELRRGGTGLSLAIQESIQYFRNTTEDMIGNILIFTDAEETDGGIELSIPKGISVGVVGVGTAKGSTIPIRNSKNVFIGNKKYEGEVVISKLDEDYLKKLGDNIENYKYWVASSYSLPTEEIVNFFNRSFELKTSKNEYRIRPIYAHYFLVPGMILFIVSMLLDFKKSFVTLMLIMSLNGYCEDQKEDKRVKSERTLSLEKKLKDGNLNEAGIMDLASSLLKDKYSQEAELLYQENLQGELGKKNLREHFNLATSMLQNKKPAAAINKYNDILNYMEDNTISDDVLSNELKKNILKALQQNAGGGKGEGESEDEQGEDQKKNNQSEKGQNDKDKKQDNKSNKNKDKKENKDNENQNNDENNKKDKKKNEKKESKSESGSERNERKKKVPVLLKQLMSDDNQLQKKLIDAKTTKNRKSSKEKDW